MSKALKSLDTLRVGNPLLLLVLAVGSVTMLLSTEGTTAASKALQWSSIGLLVLGFGLALRTHYLTGHRLRHYESERIARTARLSRDEGTDLLLRRAFMDAAHALAAQTDSGPRSLALLDIDHLKSLNDAFGHRLGDAVIARVGAALTEAFPEASIGRLGGDEFCIFCEGSNPKDFEARIEAMRLSLHQPVSVTGHAVGVTVSGGLVHLSPGRVFLDEVLHHADLALYASKKSGRDRATVFSSEMLKDAQQRRFIERELRSAILLNELDVAYQPIVDASGAVVAVEALVRWHHAVRGVIPPSEFIPVAEETTLIDLLGEWVLRRACADAAALGDLRVSVNISANQIKRDMIEEIVAAIVAETKIQPQRLVLELTESAAIVLTDTMRRRLLRLTERGIGIALDDFGTGYCGIGYLRAFPVRTLKIDRSYVTRLGCDAIDDAIVSAISHVGNAMRINLVAEGVETEEQMQLAKLAGCNLFQGFHIARPMPKDALLAFLSEHAGERRFGTAAG